MLLKRKYLFGTTILAGVMAVSAPAFAQDTQLPGVTARGQAEPVTELTEIVSTGSRLRRDPANSPTPLISVSGEDLLSTGQSTVIDYLATIPALSNSVVPSDTTGSNLADGGLSLPNLRSLGSGRTLTLIDGRRQVGSSGGSLAVDIDTIPRLLIQNIEIITGGASSVYGADAVSGVLNFVLRKDFEGLEIDANYGMINQAGQANRRVSVLGGINLLDDRLNLWAFGEYDNNDEVLVSDIDWLQNSYVLGGPNDSDPALGSPNGPASDGIIDNLVYRDVRTLSRPRWGQTTIANTRPGVPTRDPEYGTSNCTGFTQAACFGVNPGATWVFEGPTARLADFGTRIGFGTQNFGGDGENSASFGQFSRVPDSESQRYAAGLNFDVTPNVRFSADVKYVTEDTFDTGQPVFYDFYINNVYTTAGDIDNALNGNSYNLRLADTAYLPANLRTAISNNVVTNYTNPTTNLPGQPVATIAAPWARHVIFGPDRTQSNTRELFRATAALEGSMDSLLFVKNFNWSLSYVYGELDTVNTERGTDDQRVNLSSDAVVDTAGVVNGRPGEIVCRAKLVRAQGGVLVDTLRGGLLTDTTQGTAALNECVPLNIFGNGNQSAEALAYISAEISPTERNEQEQAVAFVSGELFDLWGAGPVGLAVGAEYRREYTEGVGRDADTAGRILFLNTGQDFEGVQYESEEVFAEISIPLFRDSWLGRYAELSGSYRAFDYTTAGSGDVYGVNFVYRPIEDIAFKASFNTSFRAPNLGENFSPIGQTFANNFVDPCSTATIQGLRSASDPALYQQRIDNCQAILNRVNAARGTTFAYDFSGLNTPTDPNDDYSPSYTSGIAGSGAGNPNLRPEQSESLTLSMVIEPRFFPNLSLVLDYYEIEINDVIASLAAVNIATNCVSGATLNEEACALIYRNNPFTPGGTTAILRSEGFKVGAPNGDPIGGFIEQPFNYASLKTRGLDFTARYSLDTEETFGMNLGRFDYSIRGLWLIEQKQFLNQAAPTQFTDLSSGLNYPRVRLSSSLTWSPNSTWSVNWTADWQTAQDSQSIRGAVNNLDIRPYNTYQTGDFTRHDFSVRYNVNDQLTVRAGVTNAFDAEQPNYLGATLVDNFDPYGTRFNIGLNWRPW
ncbi:TonB-dependent receptor domain-containing protein [Brevundimonas sp.]